MPVMPSPCHANRRLHKSDAVFRTGPVAAAPRRITAAGVSVYTLYSNLLRRSPVGKRCPEPGKVVGHRFGTAARPRGRDRTEAIVRWSNVQCCVRLVD